MTTNVITLPLTLQDRKDLLGHGAATEIARKLGVGPSLVSRVIREQATSRRVAQAVADHLELPLGDVFPRYRKRLVAA